MKIQFLVHKVWLFDKEMFILVDEGDKGAHSMYFSDKDVPANFPYPEHVHWLRPSEINENAMFFNHNLQNKE